MLLTNSNNNLSFGKLLKLKRSSMSFSSIWFIPTHSYYYISLLHVHNIAESSKANLSYFKSNTTDNAHILLHCLKVEDGELTIKFLLQAFSSPRVLPKQMLLMLSFCATCKGNYLSGSDCTFAPQNTSVSTLFQIIPVQC